MRPASPASATRAKATAKNSGMIFLPKRPVLSWMCKAGARPDAAHSRVRYSTMRAIPPGTAVPPRVMIQTGLPGEIGLPGQIGLADMPRPRETALDFVQQQARAQHQALAIHQHAVSGA